MLSAFGTVLLLYSHQSDMVKLQFWAGVGAIAGVFLFLRGFSMLRYKRMILNTPSSKIRSASMGLVEISGTAKGPQTVPAGITGQACYYYRAMAWQLRQSGRNREWKKVADESLYVPFFIEDATGEALVDPQGAELDIHRNFKDEIGGSLFGSGNMMPENANAFLLRYGLSGSERIRLEEYCIKPGDPLFVLGTLCQNEAAAHWTPCPHVAALGSSFKSRLNFFGPTGSTMLRTLGWAPGLKVTAGRKREHLRLRRNAIGFVECRQLVVGFPGRRSHARRQRRGQRAAGGLSATSVETGTAPPEASPEAQSATGFNTHSSVAIGKGTNRRIFHDFLAQPAPSSAVAGLEIGAVHLGRTCVDAGLCLFIGSEPGMDVTLRITEEIS